MFEDATRLPGGVSRSLAIPFPGQRLATNVNLHGTSPWHPDSISARPLGSNQREPPPGKPVASKTKLHQYRLRTPLVPQGLWA